MPRDRALGTAVARLVDAAFAGSAEGLVLALLGVRGVSDEEARLIADARAKGGARRG